MQLVTPSIRPYLATASAITASTCQAQERVTCLSPSAARLKCSSAESRQLRPARACDAWRASATTGWQPGTDEARESSLPWSRPCRHKARRQRQPLKQVRSG